MFGVVVAHLGVFWQHTILVVLVATIGASSTIGAALLNRRMGRIEVRLNGRLDQALGLLEAKDAEDRKDAVRDA